MHGGGDEVPKFGLTRTSSISWLGVMIDMLTGDSVGYDCISVSLGHKENVIRNIPEFQPSQSESTLKVACQLRGYEKLFPEAVL